MLEYFPFSVLNIGLHKFNKHIYRFIMNPSGDKLEFFDDSSLLPSLALPKLPIMAA